MGDGIQSGDDEMWKEGMKTLEKMVEGERRIGNMVGEREVMERVWKMIEGERSKKEKMESGKTVRVLEFVYGMMKRGVSVEKEEEIVLWAEEMERESNRRIEKREEGEEGGEEEKEWERIGEIGALITREKIRKERRKRGEKQMTEGEGERERERMKRENEEEIRTREKVERREREETRKREEAEEKSRREELEREIERMKREREEEKKQSPSIIRDVSETVVKIPNRETIQEGNRFHNKRTENETIIIGNKMSRV